MSLCDRCKNKCKFMLKNKTLDTCGLFEKQTNFDRITKTPEALANYIGGVINYALRKESEKSKTDHERYSNMFQGLGHAIEWLKQESNNE